MLVDLHCHSHYSDGVLSPQELVQQAEFNGIKIFSITDHDNIDAYGELNKINTTVTIIPGIEFSTTWNKIGVHIVGLNFQVNSSNLLSAIASQKKSRCLRAQLISEKLTRFGLIDGYEKIMSKKRFGQIGRPDFAEILVEEGIFKSREHAFKKVLGSGKVCDIKSHWLPFEEVINVINLSGGIAVLAHPLYYGLTNSNLKRLLKDFKNFGGQGMEILNGFQTPDKSAYLLKLCQDYSLLGSIGSDFHFPSKWSRLGCNTKVIQHVGVVWDSLL